MCFPSRQRGLAPPPLPAPAAPTPTAADPSVVRAKQGNRARAALAAGRSSTILTSGLGLTTPATTAFKTALGS